MTMSSDEGSNRVGLTRLFSGRSWWLAPAVVMSIALLATVPIAGELGLTWDEPAYRYCQMVEVRWWEHPGQARSGADMRALLDSESLPHSSVFLERANRIAIPSGSRAVHGYDLRGDQR
jgi:hypothetical protein